MQGSTDERRFVALYGHQGRTVAAATFDQGKWLDFYREQIEMAAPFSPRYRNVDHPASRRAIPRRVPGPAVPNRAPADRAHRSLADRAGVDDRAGRSAAASPWPPRPRPPSLPRRPSRQHARPRSGAEPLDQPGHVLVHLQVRASSCPGRGSSRVTMQSGPRVEGRLVLVRHPELLADHGDPEGVCGRRGR